MNGDTKALFYTMAIILSFIGLFIMCALLACHKGPGYIYYSEKGIDKIMHVQSYLLINSHSARIVTDDGDTKYYQNIYEYYSDEYIEEE